MEKKSSGRRNLLFIISIVCFFSMIICGAWIIYNVNLNKTSQITNTENVDLINETTIVSCLDLPYNQFVVTWNAGDGCFYAGSENETNLFQTITELNKKYSFPEVQPTRIGYDFLGWFESDNLSSQIYENSYFYDSSKVLFVAKWEQKLNLEVKVLSDNNISAYSIFNDNAESFEFVCGQSENTKIFSGQSGATKFTIENITCLTNYEFQKLVFTKQVNTKTVNAVEGVDYTLLYENNHYIFEIGTSLIVTLTSGVSVTLISLSNFEDENTFVENTYGGWIGFGAFDEKIVLSSSQKIFVESSESLQLNAKINKTKSATFKGFYSSNNYDAETGILIFDNPISTALSYNLENVHSSLVIYAVFVFEYCNINVSTYYDDKNFVDKTIDIMPNEIGGTASIRYNNVEETGCNVSLRVPKGEYCDLSFALQTIDDDNAILEFVGYYISKTELINDKENTPDTGYNLQTSSICVSDNINLFAKVVKKYALIFNVLDDGITNISIGDEVSTDGTIKKFYYYNQEIKDVISCTVTDYGYENYVVWQVLENNTVSANVKDVINSCNVSILTNLIPSFAMKDKEIVLTVQGFKQYYNLEVMALVGDLKSTFNISTMGGTANIISTSVDDDVKFNADNGIMQENNSVKALVLYQNTTISVEAITKENYVFGGWYLASQFVDGNIIGEPFSTDVVYALPQIESDIVLYSVFLPCHTFILTVDENVADVEITGNNIFVTQANNTSPYIIKTYCGNNVEIVFDIPNGKIVSLTQLQSNSQIVLNTSDDLSNISFEMPSYDVELYVASIVEIKYGLTVATFCIDNQQYFYCDEDGFDAGCGQVAVKGMKNFSTEVHMIFDENTSRSLVEQAGSQYEFFGWYKLKTGAIYNKNLIISKNVNDQTEIANWFNIYDAQSNSDGAFIYCGSGCEIATDELDMEYENLFIAVFVKQQNENDLSGNVSGDTLTIQSSYATVIVNGYLDYVSYIKYSVTTVANAEKFTSTAQIQSEDNTVYFLFGLYKEYTVSSITGYPIDSKMLYSKTTKGNIIEYVYSITQLGDPFSITIQLTPQKYKTEFGQLLYDESSSAFVSLDHNSVKVVASGTNLSVNKSTYLSKVDYVAAVNSSQQTILGKTVDVMLYEFVGWFAKCGDSYIQVSSSNLFTTTVLTDITYYAVFKNVSFTVRFVVPEEYGQLTDQKGNIISKAEQVAAGNDITKQYYAKPYAGYSFNRWDVKLCFGSSSESYSVFSSISSFGDGVYCDIICTAQFAKKSVTVNILTQLTDETNAPDGNYVCYLDQQGQELSISTKMNTSLSLKAISIPGFEFVKWKILEDPTTYELTKNPTDILELMLMSNSLTNYTIVAVFDYADVIVDIKFDVKDKVDFTTFAFVTTTDASEMYFPFSIKSSQTLMFYINVFKGFYLTNETIKYTIDDNDIVVSIENVTSSMSELDNQLYSQKFLVAISNFKQNTTITFLGESERTTLHFASLLNFEKSEYTDDAFIGYINYCTTQVNVENNNLLIPNLPDLTFLGWSTNKFLTGIILDEQGNLLIDYWTKLDENLTLYPIYEKLTLNLSLSISTIEGVANSQNFLQDAISNISQTAYTISDDLIIFDVGSCFELTVPALKDKYYFYGYEYFIVEDNVIKKEFINLEMLDKNGEEYTLTSISLFEMKHYADYMYSTALNYEDFNMLTDGVLYINYILEIEISLEVENYLGNSYVDNIGGSITLLNTTNFTRGLYNQILQVKAIIDDGYEIQCWYVNSTPFDTNVDILEYTLQKPTTFKVVYVGKTVKIKFGESSVGQGTNILGTYQYNSSDNSYLARVGDNISLFAKSNIGYKFENNWLHSNGKKLYASIYKVTPQDAEDQVIVLTPLFVAKNIDVWIFVPEDTVTLYRMDAEMPYTVMDHQWLYGFKMNYFDEVKFSFLTKTKYRFASASLTAGDSQLDITNKVENDVLILNYQYYNDALNLTINLMFDKLYWQSAIEENNLIKYEGSTISLKKDFGGSGKSNDPYRIDSLNDLIKLAYVINNDIQQTNLSSKNVYNSPNTFYSINRSLNLEEKFWTPIGTKENPFNSVITIYYLPSNIFVDKSDPHLTSSESLDEKVLSEYGGLFGYLGDNAKIITQVHDITSIYVIVGVVCFVMVAVVVIILIMKKIRKEKIKNFDEHNKYLFDIE